jgi:hypothetical protein
VTRVAGSKKQKASIAAGFFHLNDGAQRRNRTTDTRIFNPLLYRLSYLGETGLNGAAYPSRTDDLLITSQLLYQLS